MSEALDIINKQLEEAEEYYEYYKNSKLGFIAEAYKENIDKLNIIKDEIEQLENDKLVSTALVKLIKHEASRSEYHITFRVNKCTDPNLYEMLVKMSDETKKETANNDDGLEPLLKLFKD